MGFWARLFRKEKPKTEIYPYIWKVVVIVESELMEISDLVVFKPPVTLIDRADEAMSKADAFPRNALITWVKALGSETLTKPRITDTETDALCAEIAEGKKMEEFSC